MRDASARLWPHREVCRTNGCVVVVTREASADPPFCSACRKEWQRRTFAPVAPEGELECAGQVQRPAAAGLHSRLTRGFALMRGDYEIEE